MDLPLLAESMSKFTNVNCDFHFTPLLDDVHPELNVFNWLQVLSKAFSFCVFNVIFNAVYSLLCNFQLIVLFRGLKRIVVKEIKI